MPDTLRAFIAVPIEASPSLRKLLRQLSEIGGPVKVVSPEQLHLTVKFLGDTPWTGVADVSRLLERVVGNFSAFEAGLRTVGAFPDLQRPRVVWTGLSPAEPLGAIAAMLNDQLGDVGFPRENRSFQPHVTLVRIKGRPPETLRSLLMASRDLDFGGIPIDRVVLYQSELGTGGPKYTGLSEYELS
jgi:2'-5' RNA ligase